MPKVRMLKIHYLYPTRQNSTQRRGFFGALALIAVVLFLHFPFEGYRTTFDIPGDNLSLLNDPKCRGAFTGGIEKLRTADSNEIMVLAALQRECGEKYGPRIVEIPLSQWSSNSPVIDWFGSVTHTLTALVLVVILGGLWLWVFRSDREE